MPMTPAQVSSFWETVHQALIDFSATRRAEEGNPSEIPGKDLADELQERLNLAPKDPLV